VVDMIGHPNFFFDRGWWGDLPGGFDTQHDRFVSGGNDTILGDDGSDVLFGQSGSDALYGGDGDDWLIGGGGPGGPHQILDGGNGDDQISHGDDNSGTLRDLVAQLLTVWFNQFAAFGSAQGLVSPSPWIADYALNFSPNFAPGDLDEFFVLSPYYDLDPVSSPVITSAPYDTLASFAVYGIGSPGQLISLYDTATGALLGTAIVTATGNWTIQVIGLALGAHTIYAAQTDRIELITSEPSRGAIVNVFNATPPPTLAALPNVPVTFTITGTGVAGDTVYVYDGSTLIGKLKITASNGTWSLAVTLSPGSHTLSATEVDPVSTLVSVVSNVVTTNVIAVPPAPTLAVAAKSAPSVTATGSCVAGDTVLLYDKG